MSTVLVDSNVVLDIADKSSSWHEWSLQTLEHLEYENNLMINRLSIVRYQLAMKQLKILQHSSHVVVLILLNYPKRHFIWREKPL